MVSHVSLSCSRDNLDNRMVFMLNVKKWELSQLELSSQKSCKNILDRRGNHEERGIVAVIVLAFDFAFWIRINPLIVQQIPLGGKCVLDSHSVSLDSTCTERAAFSYLTRSAVAFTHTGRSYLALSTNTWRTHLGWPWALTLITQVREPHWQSHQALLWYVPPWLH